MKLKNTTIAGLVIGALGNQSAFAAGVIAHLADKEKPQTIFYSSTSPAAKELAELLAKEIGVDYKMITQDVGKLDIGAKSDSKAFVIVIGNAGEVYKHMLPHAPSQGPNRKKLDDVLDLDAGQMVMLTTPARDKDGCSIEFTDFTKQDDMGGTKHQSAGHHGTQTGATAMAQAT